MKSQFTWALAVACLGAGEVCADDLDWLLGCWEDVQSGSKEVWVRGQDRSLLGFGATPAEGQIGFFEILQIYRASDGGLAYAAYPMGGPPTVFTATVSDAGSVVFVNAAHDYPQRIAYRREGARLFSTISELDGARPRSFDKTRCD